MSNINQRFSALDQFRGFTIASMILVNTPGSWSYVWGPFGHAEWHGLTFADFVFPWFLMISGMGFAFSRHFRRVKTGNTDSNYSKLLRRVALLFLIGLSLNWFPFIKDWEQVRIFGILQRIALAYGLGAIIILVLKEQRKYLILVSITLLLFYWVLMYFGGAGDDPFSLTNNLMRKVDLLLMNESHMYRGEGIAFDPEGLMGTMSAAVNVMIGFIVAQFIIQHPFKVDRIRALILGGAMLLIIGYLIDPFFPINKKIWTSSFVLVSCGYGLIVLATFLAFEENDLAQKIVYPFKVYGLNPLFSFILSVLIVKIYFLFQFEIDGTDAVNTYSAIYKVFFVPIFGNAWGSFFFALYHVILIWLIVLPLYKKKIVIKI